MGLIQHLSKTRPQQEKKIWGEGWRPDKTIAHKNINKKKINKIARNLGVLKDLRADLKL